MCCRSKLCCRWEIFWLEISINMSEDLYYAFYGYFFLFFNFGNVNNSIPIPVLVLRSSPSKLCLTTCFLYCSSRFIKYSINVSDSLPVTQQNQLSLASFHINFKIANVQRKCCTSNLSVLKRWKKFKVGNFIVNFVWFF